MDRFVPVGTPFGPAVSGLRRRLGFRFRRDEARAALHEANRPGMAVAAHQGTAPRQKDPERRDRFSAYRSL